MALRLAGRADEASEALRESLAIAERHGLNTAIALAAGKLAVLNLTMDDFDGALRWCAHASTAVGGQLAPSHALELSATAVQACLSSGDLEGARAAYTCMLIPSVDAELTRGAAEYTALKVRMAIDRASATISSEQVRALYSLYSRMRDKGAQDFVVSTLLLALEARGHQGRAKAVFRNYVSRYRRERLPLPKALAETGGRIAAYEARSTSS
jgi:hypothetical protein